MYIFCWIVNVPSIIGYDQLMHKKYTIVDDLGKKIHSRVKKWDYWISQLLGRYIFLFLKSNSSIAAREEQKDKEGKKEKV